jgi:hypothetical protein
MAVKPVVFPFCLIRTEVQGKWFPAIGGAGFNDFYERGDGLSRKYG